MTQRTKLTGSPLSSMVAQWTQRSVIKSLQTNTIAITVTSNTRALSPAVDPSNCLLINLGWIYDTVDTQSDAYNARLTFTNATTITATRTAVVGTTTVTFLVIEFVPGVIKSIQQNTISVASSTTDTINPINVGKYHLANLGQTSTDISGAGAVFETALILTNSTTITATRGNNSGTTVVGYRIAEFY